MKALLLFSTLLAMVLSATAQTIQVNPDGTHSIIIDHGAGTAVVVNPDGTHSFIYNNNGIGPAVQVNPNGSHGVIFNYNSNMPLRVNPDGTHTILIRNGNMVIDPTPPQLPQVSSDQEETRQERPEGRIPSRTDWVHTKYSIFYRMVIP